MEPRHVLLTCRVLDLRMDMAVVLIKENDHERQRNCPRMVRAREESPV